MNKTLKKVWNIVSSILVALVMVLALLLVGARVVGLQVFTVLSGSMEPTYHTGSLIYVKKVDPYTIKEGQVITFMLDADTIATHRVVGIVPDEDDPTVIRFRTKGDANETEDGTLVHYKNVIGTPVFTIPYLGYVAEYIQHPPGMYVALSGGAILILLVFLPDVFADDSGGKNGDKGESNKEKKQPKPKQKRTFRRKKQIPAAVEQPVAAAAVPVDAAPDSPPAAAAPPDPAPQSPPEPAAPQQPAPESLAEELCRKSDYLLTADEAEELLRRVKTDRFDKAAAEALRRELMKRKAERDAQ